MSGVSFGLFFKEPAATEMFAATAAPGLRDGRPIAVMSEEVKRLSQQAPDAVALERSKNAYESAFLSGLESTLQRAIALASYDVQAKDPEFFAKDLARYRAVTAEQVREVVAKYLQPNMRVVLTIAPGKKTQEKAR